MDQHRWLKAAAGVVALSLSGWAHAAPIEWTDWTFADATSAIGTMAGVTVSFSGPQSPASQIGAGSDTDFWGFNPGTYTGPGIDNGPATTDIIRITDATTYTVTFSQAVVDPVMAVLSIGRITQEFQVRYDFDADFDIVNSGAGFFGGAAGGSLFEEAGDVLLGVEGHGVLRFNGTFTSISWTSDPAENWHGFTFGIVIPEPATPTLLGAALVALGWQRRRAACAG